MPTFCRHNRLEATCPVCTRKARMTGPPQTTGPRRPPARPPRSASAASSASIAARKKASRQAGGLTVRRLAGFSEEDGFDHDLVPGLRSSADAARLADELAFAAARLAELSASPPGLLGEIAALEDRDAAAELCFLVAYLGPLEDADDPFASVRAAREGAALDGLARGPRGVVHAGTPEAWRRFAAAAGGGPVAALAGDVAWEPPRRFERAFERLALPGLARGARYELLVLLGRLGIVDVAPWSLELSSAAPDDPVLVTAKRVFGIGDVLELTRRIRALATEAAIPVAAFDLGLFDFGTPQARVTAGSSAVADPELTARVRGALGLPGGEVLND